MKIIVTGATSFIGVPVIRRLMDRGHQVFAVVRPGSRNLHRLPEESEGRLTLIPMELGEMEAIGERTGECGACFHFGWDGAGSENRTKRQVQQKNVEDSLKVLGGAALAGCRRFVFSGSQAEYGLHREAMTEETECFPVSEYAIAKVEFMNRALKLCQRWREEGKTDMEYVHTRIFSIYGPGDHPWSLVETCLKAFREGRIIELGECAQLWNFLHVDDLVEALMALMFYKGALGREAPPVFNIAGDEDETRPLKDYVEMMYALCGQKGACRYGERAPNAEGPANLIPKIERIKRVTGWRPRITFCEGIKRMLEETNR